MSRYARVPEALILDVRLSSNAVRVWARMERYQGTRGACYATREAIADDLGMSEATVKRALGELLETGWVTRVGRRGNVRKTVVNYVLDGGDEGPEQDADEPERRVTGDPEMTNGDGSRVTRRPEAEPKATGHGRPPDGSRVTPRRVTGDPSKEGTPVRNPSYEPRTCTTPPSETGAELVLIHSAAESVEAAPVAEEALPVQAGSIVGRWLDHCAKRPPRQVVGQIARQVGSLLEEGIDPRAVEGGLAAWHRKGNMHPSVLPSFVNEVLNPPTAGRGRADERRAMFARWDEISTDLTAKGL